MTVNKDQRDGVLILTIDRPAARNAINREVATALSEAIDDVADDVHAVVIASSGDVYLSGGDLKELVTLTADASGADRVLQIGMALSVIEQCDVPVIAAVDGDAFGGGCELIVQCDLVVMQRTASLQFVHARMGLVPAWGGATRLCERVGATVAADILMTARRVGADEAHAIGLVSRLADDAGAEALALADELATIGRPALANIKRALVASRNARRGDALAHEQKVFRAAWGSPQNLAAFERLRGR